MYAVTKETAAAARKAENRTVFINEKGKYIGQFTKAEKITARSGAHGIAFGFKTHEGSLSNFSVYTHSHDGEEYSDHGLVIAIMTCLGLREIKPVKMPVEEYDRDAKAMVKRDAVQFRELIGVDIGLLLAMEEFEKDNGGTGWSTRLNAVFRAADELVASEILDRKTRPEKLEHLVAALRDRPLKKKAGGNARTSGARGGDDGSYGGYDDGAPFSDDIPF